MAHHLAEVMLQAEEASGEEKAAAQAHAVDLILRLWAQRRDAPGNVDPLKEFEDVLRVLRLLKERAWPYGRSGRANLDTLLADAFSGLQSMVAHGAVLSGNPALRTIDAGAADDFQTPEEREIVEVVNEWVDFANVQRARADVRIVFQKDKADEERELAEIHALLKMEPQARARVLLARRIDELLHTLSSLKTELAAEKSDAT